jgi:hypothetical protein
MNDIIKYIIIFGLIYSILKMIPSQQITNRDLFLVLLIITVGFVSIDCIFNKKLEHFGDETTDTTDTTSITDPASTTNPATVNTARINVVPNSVRSYINIGCYKDVADSTIPNIQTGALDRFSGFRPAIIDKAKQLANENNISVFSIRNGQLYFGNDINKAMIHGKSADDTCQNNLGTSKPLENDVWIVDNSQLYNTLLNNTAPTYVSTIPTDAPTPAPTTEAPTPAPTTEAPTPAPTTEAPTPAPTTEAPTPAPTTEAPTPAPTTEAPTPAPTTTAPKISCDLEVNKIRRQMEQKFVELQKQLEPTQNTANDELVLKYFNSLLVDLKEKELLNEADITNIKLKLKSKLLSMNEVIGSLEQLKKDGITQNKITNNKVKNDMIYNELPNDFYTPIGDKIANDWENSYTILNTNKWQVPVIRPPVCINNTPCAVCPSQSSSSMVSLKEWDDSRYVTQNQINKKWANDQTSI